MLHMCSDECVRTDFWLACKDSHGVSDPPFIHFNLLHVPFPEWSVSSVTVSHQGQGSPERNIVTNSDFLLTCSSFQREHS